MNRDHVQRTRDLIASRKPEQIKMETWYTFDNDVNPTLCGTAGCIAGWATLAMAVEAGNGALVFEKDDNYGNFGGWKDNVYHRFDIKGIRDGIGRSSGEEYLDLDDGTAIELFHAGSLPGSSSFFYQNYATPQEQKDAVLRVLDILLETGEVDWPRAVREATPRLSGFLY
jgi:hypothetical protein